MAKYTDAFRIRAVRLYSKLLREGSVEVDLDLTVVNIRQLVAFLEISSYTLYKWAEKYPKEEVPDIVEIVDKIEEAIMTEDELTLIESEDDFFEDPMISTRTLEKEGVFNSRYYSWFAGVLNVPYASRNAKETNMLKIGLELIKRSGLVDCDKIKKALRVK